jgi:magnesium transporter
MICSLFRSHDGNLTHDLTPQQLRDALADRGGLLWLDVVTAGEDADRLAGLLGDLFAFHPLALDDALREAHVPRVDDWQGYLFLVLHAVALAADHTLQTHEFDVFLGPNYLVTVREGPVAPLEHLWDQCQRGSERRLAAGAAHLLYALADAVAADYMPVVDALDDEIDRIEAAVFRRSRPQLVRSIFRLRRSLLKLRRTLGALREVLNRLARDDYAVVGQGERVYFRDVYDHLVRLYDVVEGLRDMAAGALDSYLSVTSNRINEVMRTLTVVSVLFLPLSFLAGFFGMNFFGESFNVANPLPAPLLLWLCLGLMAVTPLAMWWWMARRGMLGRGGVDERPGPGEAGRPGNRRVARPGR